MRKNKLIILVTYLFIVAMIGLTGCSSKETTAPIDSGPKPEALSPVTVKVGMQSSGYYNDREFNQYIVDPVKKKYPQITIELVEIGTSEEKLGNMIAQGNIPDILITSSLHLEINTRLQLTTNIEPLLAKQHIDLGRFKSFAIDYTKDGSGTSYLVGVHYNHNYSAMAYNKDLFDRFGLPYPKDGMSWDDAIELAKKMTRAENGTQYRGLEMDQISRPASQLLLQSVYTKMNKAAVNTDQWKTFFDTMSKLYQIPGNEDVGSIKDVRNHFIKDQRLAMYPTLNVLASLEGVDGLNWDLVQFPQFKTAPNTGVQFGAHVATITNGSQVKDDAMRVISVMVSDEVQLDASRNGRISVLKDPKMQEVFGSNLSFLKGKNVSSIFKAVPAKPVQTPYDDFVESVLTNVLKQIITGTDTNTALRNANEQVDKIIQENKK